MMALFGVTTVLCNAYSYCLSVVGLNNLGEELRRHKILSLTLGASGILWNKCF